MLPEGGEPVVARATPCPDCGRSECRASFVQPRKSVERLACYEATIAKLRGEIAPLICGIARLNYELGKAQGELEGLRAGWSVSNYQAWEQGHDARRDTQNPYPDPAKARVEPPPRP